MRAMDQTDGWLADYSAPRQAGAPANLRLVEDEPQTGARGRARPFRADLIAANDDDREIAILAVRGEIDLSTAPALRNALRDVIRRETGPIVVDLLEVPFMDSTGAHVLIDTLPHLASQRRRLAIACREGTQVHKLLDLLGLLDELAVHPSREHALTDLSAAPF